MTSPDEQVKVTVLPMRCGTCEHTHPATGCPDCDCPGLVVHPEHVDRLDEAAHQELIDLQGERTTLSTDEAHAILDALAGFEADIDARLGWDVPPVLATVRFREETVRLRGAPQGLIQVAPLHVPGSFWEQGNDMLEPVEALAETAARRPGWYRAWRHAAGIDPRDPVHAWALAAEGWMKAVADMDRSAKKDPSPRLDEIRSINAIDVDGRVYTVMRVRSTGEITQRQVLNPVGYRRLAVEGMRQAGLDPAERLGEEGMSRAHAAMLRLMGLSVAEQQERQQRQGGSR